MARKSLRLPFFVGHGDQPPVAVSGRNFDSEDWGGCDPAP
jgi:hypothetical protein